MVKGIIHALYNTKILNSSVGLFVGIIFIFAGIILVFWSEGHGLYNKQSLEEINKSFIPVPNSPINPQNDLKVVYLKGLATTKDNLNDKLLNISRNAIQLNRQVEMYQWQEYEEKIMKKKSDGTEEERINYTYKQIWSPTLIDNAYFKEDVEHKNPSKMPFKSFIQYANTVKVGDFKLSKELISQMENKNNINLSEINMTELQKKVSKPIHKNKDYIFIGNDESLPQIGDIRITETETKAATVSIIAEQSGQTLRPVPTKSGQSIGLLAMGEISPNNMISQAETTNIIPMWISRTLSFVMLIIGFSILLKPASVLYQRIKKNNFSSSYSK